MTAAPRRRAGDQPPPVVHLVWIDSCHHGGWRDADEIAGLKHDDIETVGYLIAEDDEILTVAHSRSPLTGTFGGVLSIPKVAIRERKTVLP